MGLIQWREWGNDYEIAIDVEHYTYGGGLALCLSCKEGDTFEPYVTLTVNLAEYPTEKNLAFVDTNNFPEAERFIADNKLGKPTGRYGRSGFCRYPEYEFDLEEIGKYSRYANMIKECASASRDDAR